jgi:MFS family permease
MRGSVKLFLVVLSLGVLFWPGIQRHWETANDPYFVPFDAAHVIPPFFKFDRNDPIPTNYVKEYYLNALSPFLYKWSIAIGARFADVRHFQLAMLYLTYVVFIGILGRLGWLLGGAALSFAVMALTVTAWIFIGLGFLGATPRMYAYPVIALILYALIRDRPRLLVVTVIVSGMLYPIVATIGGLCLASWMLLKPLSAQGSVSHWRRSHRLATVALTGFLTLAGLLPMWLDSQPYGRRVNATDIALYPEAGPDGNYRAYDQLPYKFFGNEWMTYFVGPMYSHGDPIAPWVNVHKKLDSMTLLFVLALMGLIVLVVICAGIRAVLKEDSSGAAVRLIGFFAVCGVLHVIAWLGAPYLYIPTRFFMYSLPFLITLIFPWSLYILLGRVPRLRSSANLHALTFLGIITVYLMAFGGRGNVEFAASSEKQLFKPLADAITALPKDVLIAGWPAAEIRNVEYVTRRNVFFTAATHHVLHLTYMKIMRERMNAMFDAYLSVDAAPLVRLRQEFGVTHLLVDTRDFTEPAHAPEYFAPWRARIAPRLAEIKGKEYLMNGALQKKAAVFNQDGLILLDLAKLP